MVGPPTLSGKIAKENLKIADLMQTFFSSPRRLNRILRYCTLSPWVCVINTCICSNGGYVYIITEIIAKVNLNIANFMQTFENLFSKSAQFRYCTLKVLGYE